MISGWVMKLVLGIALLGLVLFEIGSPLITRAQLDDRANNAAFAALREIRDGKGQEKATLAAQEVAGEDFREIEYLPDGKITVTMETTARSFVVYKYVKRLRSWYQVRLEATAP